MDYDALEAVDFGEAMHTIGENAFQSCEGLTAIHLPATFRRFSKECFAGCTALKEVWCDGGMPSFNMNCLWNYGKITIYSPVNNPWPASKVEELEENFGGRLQVLTGDGEDPFDFGPEETTEATTEPATEAATEPVTEATEELEETVEETTIPAETVEETDSEEESFLAGKSWIAIVILAVLLILMLTGTLIVRASSRGSKSGKKGSRKGSGKRGGKYVR
jgi:hypothetical protein